MKILEINSKKILLLHEFGATSREWLQGQVAEQLRHRGWDVVWRYGLLSEYKAGGFGFVRLGNLLYCYLTFPWHLWSQRPAAVLVRTVPPGIQLWMSFWGALMGTKVVWWLMDYHPEIEARMLEQRSAVGWVLAQILRAYDRWALDCTHGVIAIDEAMAEGVRGKSSKPHVDIYPTWSPESNGYLKSYTLSESGNQQPITLLHLGNFGFAHDLSGLEGLIEAAPASWSFRIIAVNPSERGRLAFGKLAERDQVMVEFYPKQPLEELSRWIAEERIGWGLVTLDQRFGGTVSPSKFHTYLDLHLPLLYFGPRGTNAERYCEKYTAGYHVVTGSLQESFQIIKDWQHKIQSCRILVDGIEKARKEMRTYDSIGFCNLLESALLDK